MFRRILKGILIAFVVVVVISVVASLFGNDDSKTTVTTKTVKTEKKKPAVAPKKEYKIGQDVKVGDVIFNVHNVSTMKNVGGEYGKDAQGTFLVLDVSVTNKGKKAITTDASFFKLKAKGKTYEADDVATTYANKDANFFLKEVNPDIENHGKVVFDIPAELTKSTDLKLNVQTGFFGTQQQTIALVK
ncbi:DUF4352 domain-containing protein [Weizmannia sp. CD-2023]|uniref:DUF4352 domain-containing protein n=1 Tax=Heyndrickxia TaxID=2837504 RepID=UPI002E1A80C4|nr:DUF4352 domain-containing protein [Weizmannia sp. CD-2023]MED4899794.1 DUF4352 domain-containing protein [Weizmannia sp. CD-2023]